jgi:hypothetical protein
MRQAFADICRAIRENRSIRFHTENWLFPFRRPQDIELGLHSDSSSPNSERDPNYILLCIPFQRWATKLHQPRVCHINSDQELFQALRHHYYANRGSSRWKRLRKVHGLEFVMVRCPYSSSHSQSLITYLITSSSSSKPTNASSSTCKPAHPCRRTP